MQGGMHKQTSWSFQTAMPTPKSLQVDFDFHQSKKWKYSENLMIALKQQESEAIQF